MSKIAIRSKDVNTTTGIFRLERILERLERRITALEGRISNIITKNSLLE